MQPKSPQDEIRRADEADRILNTEVFKEAVKQVEEALLNGMRSAAIVDDKQRLRLLDNYQCLQSVLQCLRSTMETGKLARAQIEMEEKRSLFQVVKDKFG